MNDTLARLHGQCMCCQSKILGFLQCLGLDECESRLPDGGDGREVGEAGRLYRHVEDDWVLGELVEMWYRLDEDGGVGSYAGELTRANRLEH